MVKSDPEIKYLDPDRYDEWNNFVDLSPQGDVFCYSWWLDAVTKSHFKILVVLENDTIVSGIPLACEILPEPIHPQFFPSN